MIMRIYDLVHDEQRAFSYLDFLNFEVNGRSFKMSHGTFRNNVSRLIKEGLVEISYKSNISFYTLAGVKLNKASLMAMTPDHMGVASSSVSVSPGSAMPHWSLSYNPLYRVIKDLPLDKTAVHDIRLRFSSTRIYAITSSSITNKVQDHDYKYTLNSELGYHIVSLEDKRSTC
jgi:hypothetical protein